MSPSEPQEVRRVGYVLKMYPRFSETFIVNELLAVEASGIDVDIFSLRPPVDGRFHEALADVRADVTYVPVRPKSGDVWSVLGSARETLPGLLDAMDELLDAEVGDAVQAVEVASAVRARGITHLHAHFGSIAATVARLAARLSGVPYTFTAHAKDIFHQSVDPADLRRKLVDASAVVTVSDFNLDFLRRTYGGDATRIVRLYNGLDLESFGYVSPRHRPPVVAAVGRLVEKKGFDHLLDATALLVASGRDLRVELVGTGPLEDALRAQVRALGLGDCVTLHGALPQSRVRRIVQGAAVLAAPCVIGADGNRDGLPTVLLEAMALGTPCVATPVTGIPEVVRDGVTGLLVDEGDARALAAALARLLDDGALRSRVSTAARALIEREFDAHQQATQLRRLFSGQPAQAGDADLGRALTPSHRVPTVEPVGVA